MAKVIGVIFILLSGIWGSLMAFTYMSKSFDNETGGLVSLGDAGVLIPIIVCAVFGILGYIMFHYKVLDSHH